MKVKLSVVIICKNEESRIRQCLESITWVDEIIVIDSGSTDKTLDIVAEYTDKIFVNTNWSGFGLQKRLAVDKASNDWVLSLDCDEVVSEQLRDEILDCMSGLDEKTVYRINRLTHFCNKFIYYSGWQPDRVVRLFNKKYYTYNDKTVHESVDCKDAEKVDLEGKLFHYTFESLEEYIDKRNGYAKAWAESHYAKGRKVGLFEIIHHTLFAFIRHYIVRRGFLDGYQGFLISVIQMQYTFNKYNFLKFKNISK
ncbi:MAG: glycosyltransferase family 2 protein [endosymbiont of Galathealinum brachiosum]|uniref:Glycosyltransferase family 2 protein n=1 Tax=endosymbiont of Galathealinum brachiosum TaxID=2200906 RepID=A0A370D9E5_9GAMM|nr:MAG: glycosyltransferase family 2 protein [endosymbiont of Galathealinum brachiosum]